MDSSCLVNFFDTDNPFILVYSSFLFLDKYVLFSLISCYFCGRCLGISFNHLLPCLNSFINIQRSWFLSILFLLLVFERLQGNIMRALASLSLQTIPKFTSSPHSVSSNSVSHFSLSFWMPSSQFRLEVNYFSESELFFFPFKLSL